MNLIKRLFSTEGGSAVRAVIRAAVICLTAFGLDLSAEQVAAIQLLVEAMLTLGTQLIPNPTPEPPKPLAP